MMTDAPPPNRSAGWYPDPHGSPQLRWFNGSTWTDAVAPLPPPVAYGYAPQHAGWNGFAIASLVVGIVWMWGIGSVLAIVFAHKAEQELARPGNGQQGAGLATAGKILGWIGVCGLALVILITVGSLAV